MNKQTQEFIKKTLENQTCSFCLNLGCGDKILESFINIDLYNPKADLEWDLREPLPYEDNKIDIIYAQHIIEHFTRGEWNKVKADWYRVIKPEGILIIECPDVIRWMKRFIANTDGKRWSDWMHGLWGVHGEKGEYNDGQLHKNGFTVKRLSIDLEEEGFDIIDFEYLYHETPHPDGFNLQVKAIK